jgi:L-threonylcarbamoyladenylate synthase
VRRSLGDRVGIIVDGGHAAVGIESTVVDTSGPEVCVLRPGMIHEESLAAALHGSVGSAAPAGTLRSPGLLPKHYSPKARVVVLAWGSDEELHKQAHARGIARTRAAVIAHHQLPSPEGWGTVHVIPHDAEAFARALYAEWHRCDEAGYAWIIMEDVPGSAEWRGIADRLRRAAAD